MLTARLVTRFFAPLACVALATLGFAQQTYLTAVINSAQETPPNTSTATGNACMILDQTAHTITFNINYSGLTSAEVAAHFHQAPAGSAGPVIIGLPAGAPKIGTLATTPAQEAAFLAGNVYINIHTSTFPGGEIRGQVLPGVVPAPVLFCFGDGAGTPCPCANHSGVGANVGCLNSAGLGGSLRTTGFQSVACDNLRLNGTQMTNSTAIYLQGTLQDNGGLGTPIQDGLRCVTGNLVRLGTLQNSLGASSYPGAGQQPVSIRGATLAGTTYYYTTFYRNAATAFCPPGTANWTNGVALTWVP
ncbi:MAG: CHRD domain-containing protein [Planctomycetes bacterium]|nr:CHRD domain-containing protein [Planctomycetota bacterium]